MFTGGSQLVFVVLRVPLLGLYFMDQSSIRGGLQVGGCAGNHKDKQDVFWGASTWHRQVFG